MKGMELYGRVRYAVRIEGLSHLEAARRFGIAPRAVVIGARPRARVGHQVIGGVRRPLPHLSRPCASPATPGPFAGPKQPYCRHGSHQDFSGGVILWPGEC